MSLLQEILKDFYRNQKDVGIKKSTTGSQCKQAWNGNTIDLLTDHRSLHQWLLWQTIASSASCR